MLEDKVCLVAGAAGGVGQALAAACLDAGGYALLGNPADEQRRIYHASVPTGRMVTVGEVADAALFLAGDKAGHTLWWWMAV